MTRESERVVDRAALHSIGPPFRNEGLQTSHVDLPQLEIRDVGVELPQEHGIVRKTSLVLVLLEELGCRGAKGTIGP
jgi:hypothetical protein